MFENVIKLLSKVNLRSFKNQNKQIIFENANNIACEVVATLLNMNKNPSEALQMLKFDRDIIAGSLLKMRTDVFELRQKHLHFADRFVFLKNYLDQSSITVNNALPSAEKFE